ncbi:MAG: hypothetical protein ABW068_16305, partial [Candidatus Thiodiazotropha sp.]
MPKRYAMRLNDCSSDPSCSSCPSWLKKSVRRSVAGGSPVTTFFKRVFDLMKDFGTSKSTKIDSIFDSLLVPR